ncbi:MAG: hypothetical protein NXI04_05690 [Planctomycetaceae bacterium]|nr:hypothetical protein [Planctomycetaceae bacterium]
MNSLIAIYKFELKRILTPGRSFWWLIVAAFPVVITAMMTQYMNFSRSGLAPDEIGFFFTIAIYFLAPSIACMLGVLLTAAPTVATELEQHSWIYLATRPNGLFYLLVGKYLVAVTWASSATILGICVAVPLSRVYHKFDTMIALCGLSVCSAFAYAALYMMIGTLFHARAMVFCVVYTGAVELFLAMFPAVVNRMTIQFRLRSLLANWISIPEQFDRPELYMYIASDESAVLQLMWLLALTAVFLSVSFASVQVREFTTAAESEL